MPVPLPADASFALELAFQGLVAVLLTLFAMSVRYAAGPRAARRVTLAMIAVLFVSGALALQGQLAFGRQPPPILWLVACTVGLSVWLGASSLGARLADRLGFVWLVGYQVFRVPVELLLHRAYREGLMPVQMSFDGYNFDIVTGTSALLVAILHAQGKLPRWGLWLWNALGVALLLNIVVISILSMPTPLRVFVEQPPNVWMTYWPFVWLPAFLVPAAVLGHVLVFRRLLRGGT